MRRTKPSLHSPPIARLLVRASTGEQTLTLEHQKTRCQEYCEGRGWVVDRVYEEAAVSARKRTWDEREQIVQALRDAENGDYDYLVVWNGDRLARVPGEQELLYTLFKRYGVSVCFADPKAPKAERGVLTEMLNTLMAHYARIEVDNLIRRVRAVIRIKAEKGQWTGGLAPFGYLYNKVTGKVNVVETEAQTVREVFRLAAEQSLGGLRIARELNKAGSRRRSGKPWTCLAIQRMLKNKIYAGYLVVSIADSDDPSQCQVIETKSPLIPPVISEEIWLAAQHNRLRWAEGQLPSRHYSTHRLFAGLLVCSCGDHLHARSHTRRWKRKDGSVSVYHSDEYICRRARSGTGECNFLSSFKGHVIEPVLCEAIAERLRFVDLAALQDQMQKNLIGDNRSLVEQQGVVKRRITELDARIRKVVATLAEEEDAEIKQHLRERVRELRAARELDIQHEQILDLRFTELKAQVEDIEGFAERLSRWSQIFSHSDEHETKRRMILDVVDRVVLTPDRQAFIRLKVDPAIDEDKGLHLTRERATNLGSHDAPRVPECTNENLNVVYGPTGWTARNREAADMVRREWQAGRSPRELALRLNENKLTNWHGNTWTDENVRRLLRTLVPGYGVRNRQLPKEQYETVLAIAREARAEGRGWQAIANELTRLGYPAPFGDTWYHKTIRLMVQSSQRRLSCLEAPGSPLETGG